MQHLLCMQCPYMCNSSVSVPNMQHLSMQLHTYQQQLRVTVYTQYATPVQHAIYQQQLCGGPSFVDVHFQGLVEEVLEESGEFLRILKLRSPIGGYQIQSLHGTKRQRGDTCPAKMLARVQDKSPAQDKPPVPLKGFKINPHWEYYCLTFGYSWYCRVFYHPVYSSWAGLGTYPQGVFIEVWGLSLHHLYGHDA